MKTKFIRPLNLNITDPPARFAVVRLSDLWERYTDRKPRREVCRNHKFMVWDHENKEQVHQ